MTFSVFPKRGRGGHQGDYPSGERARAARLTDEQIARMRAQRADGALQKDLAREYGIGQSHVSRIVRGLVR